MTTTLPKSKIQKSSMETKNKDEKDALKIVKYWVENQLKDEQDFRKSVINVLKRQLFFGESALSSSSYWFGDSYIDVSDNLIKFWNQHFAAWQLLLLEDPVREASGQVDIDTGYSNKDDKTRELKHILTVLNDLCTEKIGAKKEYDIVETITRNPFETQLDANSEYKRFETAECIEWCFENMHKRANFPLPLTVATSMHKYSTKFALLIEHFVDPDDNSHKEYSEVSNLEFLMFLRDEQMSGLCAKRLCLGEAVSKGIITNQSLAYFIGRVYLYLTRLGIDEERLRFRQKLRNVKDHYAEDCWTAEIKSSFGWSECVLIAYRSVFDLDKVKVSLKAREKLAQPKKVENLVIKPIHKELGPAFRNDHKKVVEALKAMNEKDAMDMKAALESKGEVEFKVCTLEKTVTIKRNMVSILKETKKVHHRTFKSAVIESSFVMGRIIYCLFENSFYTRPSNAGEQKICVFRFSPLVAPKHCYIFSLVQDHQSEEVARHISKSLYEAGISYMDSTRANTYARADENGAPFSITVVSTSLVTIRGRDTQDQIFVSVDKVAAVVKELCKGQSTWAEVLQKYPAAGNIQLPNMLID